MLKIQRLIILIRPQIYDSLTSDLYLRTDMRTCVRMQTTVYARLGSRTMYAVNTHEGSHMHIICRTHSTCVCVCVGVAVMPAYGGNVHLMYVYVYGCARVRESERASEVDIMRMKCASAYIVINYNFRHVRLVVII